MAGWFYLNGRETTKQEEKEAPNLFMCRNEEICNKGFEIWPQYYHHQMNINGCPAFGASPSRRSLSDESTKSGFTVTRHGGSSGGINCQDCGNQAKKDCAHLRCRTCCKSRGFQCPTHVKSTWVPAAKRRERQQQLAALQDQQRNNEEGDKPFRAESSIRLSENSDVTPSRVCARSSSLSGFGQFPSEVTSQAVLRRVRVSSMDDTNEQYGYQTTVSIAGHVFKGILYDQGREASSRSSYGEGSSSGLRQLTLATVPTSTVSESTPCSSIPATGTLIDPLFLYPAAQLSAFVAPTQSFPPPST